MSNAVPLREAGFSLGSNLGDRLANLRAARAALAATPGARLLASAPVYETEPIGVRPEHRHLKFLNTVVVLEAPLDAAAWMVRAREIETALGRVRTLDRYAPRPVDVDLLYCGEQAVDEPELRVPHPKWAERRFVVQPLADVRPSLRLPGCEGDVQQVLAKLADSAAGVRLLLREW
ncbi:MAG: 2-amino-4-hydroxy-6-hydroxymethyldihydropteridine diphosphokinase [Kiritimatiellae bacterium]|nr:2-amino-4-hydroxy-6-hydroxymethyldihydropteridine diphosphokinase [Kiritimatiellia bacterium]